MVTIILLTEDSLPRNARDDLGLRRPGCTCFAAGAARSALEVGGLAPCHSRGRGPALLADDPDGGARHRVAACTRQIAVAAVGDPLRGAGSAAIAIPNRSAVNARSS